MQCPNKVHALLKRQKEEEEEEEATRLCNSEIFALSAPSEG